MIKCSEPQTNVPAVPRGSPCLPGELAKAGHRDQCGTFPKPSLLCCPSQMAIRGGDAGNGGSQWGGARPRKQNHTLASNPPGQRLGYQQDTQQRRVFKQLPCEGAWMGNTHTDTPHTHPHYPLPWSRESQNGGATHPASTVRPAPRPSPSNCQEQQPVAPLLAFGERPHSSRLPAPHQPCRARGTVKTKFTSATNSDLVL